jgi:hypothetical protein
MLDATASSMRFFRSGEVRASWAAIVMANFPTDARSPPPLEKKKLAPRRLNLAYLQATVKAMVDFPVPAMPLSQYI